MVDSISVEGPLVIKELPVFIYRSPALEDEDDDLENQVHYKSRGYESTKWLADVMTNRARSMGVECNIFRLGRITGDSQTGDAQFEDFFHRFIEGCIELKCFPKELLNLSTDLSPVDLTAESILKLSIKSIIFS